MDNDVQIIWVKTETLMDGSKVFNVEVNLDPIGAITEKDALEMAGKIMNAINDHSNDVADVLTA